MAADIFLARREYFDPVFKKSALKVLPGEYAISGPGQCQKVLVTVLGSCVSAVIWDSVIGLGGINHFMLPESDKVCAKYGMYAMELLINELLKAGAKKERLAVKLFGGGAVMEALSSSVVGQRNSSFALEYCSRENLRVVASDLNGSVARKIWFFSDTGKVTLRRFAKLQNSTLCEREKAYMEEAGKRSESSDVTLF